MSKKKQIVEVLEERIARGDYTLKGFPAERPLAEELGVARVTLRKALDDLEGRRVLVRQDNGRLVINERRSSSGARTAFLAPAFASPFVNHIRLEAERQGQLMGVPVRSIDFVRHDDPVIGETLQSFDNVFITGIGTDAPPLLLERIERAGCRVVAIEGDLSPRGIPSLSLFPTEVSRVLFEYLVEVGYRQIHCLNTLPMTPGIERRIDFWKTWTARHGVQGTLHNEPVQFFKSPMRWAHERTRALADGGHMRSGAIFSTSEMSAIGAMRALLESGLRVGRDVGMCSLGGDGYYEFLNPTMTVVEMPSPEPFLKKYLAWMKSGRARWTGELLTTPSRPKLYVGESTMGKKK